MTDVKLSTEGLRSDPYTDAIVSTINAEIARIHQVSVLIPRFELCVELRNELDKFSRSAQSLLNKHLA